MTGEKSPKLDEIGGNLDEIVEIDGNFVKLVEIFRNFNEIGRNWF